MSRPSANIDPSTRPYPCPYPGCEWRFARLEHQTRHLRTHSGERPFQCQYANCPSKFARNDELKRHIRLVHEWDKNDSPGLADSDVIVFNGSHQRSPSMQKVPSGAPRQQVPARPQTSMSHHRPSYSGPGSPPPTSSSRSPSSSSSSSSRGILPLHPASVSMAQQPLAPLHPPLPMQYHRSPSDRRSQTPLIHLPPLRQSSDGYSTDTAGGGVGGGGGGRRGEVRLPGFNESFSQIRMTPSSSSSSSHDQSSYSRRVDYFGVCYSEVAGVPKGPSLPVTRLTGHSSCVNALAWSGNGRWLATAGDDANIALWDFHPTEPVLSAPDIFRGSLANILCLAFTASSHFILSGSVDGRVFQYDLSRMSEESSSSSSLAGTPRSRSVYNVQNDNDACIRGVAPNPSKDVIFLIASEDGFVTAYDTRVPSYSYSSTNPSRGVGSISLDSEATGVQFHPTMDNLFITSDGKGRCKLWDIRTAFSTDQQQSKNLLQYVTKLSKHGKLKLSNPEASSVVFDPSGTKLAVTMQHFLPTFYDLWDEWPIAVCSAPLLPMAPPVQTEMMATTTATRRIFETTDNTDREHHTSSPPERSYVNACSIKHGSFWSSSASSASSQRGLYYGAGSDDFRGYVWKIPDGLPEYRKKVDFSQWVAEPNDHVDDLAFAKSVTGHRIIPQLLDKPQFLIYGHKSIINTVLFHPFEPYIATAGIERHVLIHSPFRTTPICENMNKTDTTVRRLPTEPARTITATTDDSISHPPRRQSGSSPQQINEPLATLTPPPRDHLVAAEEVSNYDAEFSDTDEAATIRYFDGLLISEGTPDVFDLRSWSDADSMDGSEDGYETTSSY